MEGKLKIRGVRGSRPICDRDYLCFGGNTFCVELILDGKCLIFDAGTGISNIDDCDIFPDINIFFTHYHIDHFMGLYYFKYMFDKSKSINFYGFDHPDIKFNEILKGIFSPLYFPLCLENFSSRKTYNSLKPDTGFKLGDNIKIDTFGLNHPGGAMGYAVSCGNKKIAICTDTAPIVGERRSSFYRFLEGTDILLLDTFFMQDEVIAEWGHSSYREALEILNDCDVKQVMLTHYSAMSDEALRRSEAELSVLNPALIFAKEGMCIEL